MAKLYTHTGDTGTTSLIGGERVSKCDERIIASGDIDELNAHVGLLDTFVSDDAVSMQLADIQALLFKAGTWLSSQSEVGRHSVSAESSIVLPSDIRRIESWIDIMQAETPQPHTFILPGGCQAAAQSHVCRVVVRRVERSIVKLSSSMALDAAIMQLFNRLSDYFFALSLKLNFISQVEEKKLYISCK